MSWTILSPTIIVAASRLARRKLTRLHRFAVDGLPACGGAADVLRRHGLDAWSL